VPTGGAVWAGRCNPLRYRETNDSDRNPAVSKPRQKGWCDRVAFGSRPKAILTTRISARCITVFSGSLSVSDPEEPA